MPKPDPKWITLSEGAEIEGSSGVASFGRWVRKWNENPNNKCKISRRDNRVEKHSLLAALEEDAARYAVPDLSQQRALVERQSRNGQNARLN